MEGRFIGPTAKYRKTIRYVQWDFKSALKQTGTMLSNGPAPRHKILYILVGLSSEPH
jgi:hypothetical protein